MDTPGTRGRTVDNRHLSVSFGADADSGRPRSLSTASSMRTVIEERLDLDDHKPAIQRRRTQVVIVEKPSWWDLFKALFLGPKDLQQKLGATAEVAEFEDAGPAMLDDKDCPFSLTVSAFSHPDSTVIPAKCALDTGCFQGNIIGIDLARRLGFSSFQPLKPREENGGVVATGHVHTVVGAVHVSWFHSTSPQVFRDMRFLVSESAKVDLVIGTHSIMRSHLLSPPNLGAGIGFVEKSEPTREDLAGAEGNMKTSWENAKRKKKSPDEINLAFKQWKVAELDVALYDMKDKVKKLNDSILKASKQKGSKAIVEKNKLAAEKASAESEIEKNQDEKNKYEKEIDDLRKKITPTKALKKPGVGQGNFKL